MNNQEFSYEELDVIKDLLVKRKLNEALERINAYKEKYPKDDYILTMEADYIYTAGRKMEAFNRFEELIVHHFKRTISRIKTIMLYGDLLKLEGNIDRCKEIYYLAYINGKKKANQATGRALIKLADIYFFEENYDKAFSLLELEPYSSLSEILVHKANFFIRLGDNLKAIQELNKCKKEKPFSRVELEKHFTYGWAYFNMCDYDNAIANFNVIASHTSLKADMAKYYLGKSYYRLGRYRDAYKYANSFYSKTVNHKEDALVLLLDILSKSSIGMFDALLRRCHTDLSDNKYIYYQILYLYLKEDYQGCLTKIREASLKGDIWRINKVSNILCECSNKLYGEVEPVSDLLNNLNNKRDDVKKLIMEKENKIG